MKIKLKKVLKFSKDATDGYTDFAVIFHTKNYWSADMWDNNYEPMIGYSKTNIIESFEWMNYPAIMEKDAIKESIDLKIVKNAKLVKEGLEVEVLDEAFKPKKTGEPSMIYDGKKDTLLTPGPRNITGSINLGKGVYFLLSEGKVSGLLIKDARKKYEQAEQLNVTN